MVVMSFGKVTLFSVLQLANALVPKAVTLSGIARVVTEEHLFLMSVDCDLVKCVLF